MEEVAMLSRFEGFQRASTRWQDRALCKDDDTNTWFPEPPSSRKSQDHARYAADVAFAKAICKECPVKDLCYADAESRGEVHGVWGGEDFYQSRHRQRDNRDPQYWERKAS